MQLDSKNIPCAAVNKVLQQIMSLDLPLVLWGGAVRDILFSTLTEQALSADTMFRDIDLAVILQRHDIALNDLHYKNENTNYTITTTLRTSFEPLCHAWQIELNDFFKDATGSRVNRYGTRIDAMGLRPVFDSSGQSYPDVFALDNKETFSAVPISLSVNRFALDCNYYLYGPLEYLDDFASRTARFLHPPSLNNMSILLLLRLVDYIKRFNLTLEIKSADVLQKHLLELESNPSVVRYAIPDKRTQILYFKEFGQDLQYANIANILKNLRKRFTHYGVFI